MAVISAADGRDFGLRHADLRQRFASALDELLACMCEFYATRRADEEGRAQSTFKVTNATADGRLLNAKSGRSPAEAAMISGGDHIADVPQFNT